MASTTRTRQRWIAMSLTVGIAFAIMGSGVIAGGVATKSPVPQAEAQFAAFKQYCATNPEMYARGAVRGVYREQVLPGGEIDQICSLYSAPRFLFPSGKWLGDYISQNCGQVVIQSVAPGQSDW